MVSILKFQPIGTYEGDDLLKLTKYYSEIEWLVFTLTQFVNKEK